MKNFLNVFFSFLLLGLFVNLGQAQDLLTKQRELPCLNKKLSIVAHVTVNDQGETNIEMDSIMAALDTLNKDFAPICVEFEICAFDTIANYQYDEVEPDEWDEMQALYHQQRRINLFFVTSFPDTDTTYCGVATQGGLSNLENGGIVLLKGCESPLIRALSHQMGHYFGLNNTFNENGTMVTSELVNGTNCETEGDNICDTPADPYVHGTDPNTYVNLQLNCRFTNMQQDANGEFYVPDVGNIMSFYQAECKCGFTLGQYLVMAANCQAATDMW